MTDIILYGIFTCDTCKKARKALEEDGHNVTLRDVRAEPLTEAEWAALVAEFGDALVNRKSTTWRGLSDWLRESEAEAQLAAEPTLMKRPVLSDGGLNGGGRLTLGWSDEIRDAWR